MASLMLTARECLRNIERYRLRTVNPIANHARRIHSQGKQDGILAHVFAQLGVTTGTSVEVGDWDGITYSNTRALLENGWRCGYIEPDEEKFSELQRNIEGFDAAAVRTIVSLEEGKLLDDAMDSLGMPPDLTLPCLDIDGHEYWIWESLSRHQPLVVCVEYNAYLEPSSRQSIPYNPDHRWTGGYFYGASAGALYHLGQQRGYELVGFEPGLDLFFVRADRVASSGLTAVPLAAIPRGTRFNFLRQRHDRPGDGMVAV